MGTRCRARTVTAAEQCDRAERHRAAHFKMGTGVTVVLYVCHYSANNHLHLGTVLQSWKIWKDSLVPPGAPWAPQKAQPLQNVLPSDALAGSLPPPRPRRGSRDKSRVSEDRRAGSAPLVSRYACRCPVIGRLCRRH